jgi:hypothetical protein
MSKKKIVTLEKCPAQGRKSMEDYIQVLQGDFDRLAEEKQKLKEDLERGQSSLGEGQAQRKG